MSFEDFLKFNENIINKRNDLIEEKYKNETHTKNKKLMDFQITGKIDFKFSCVKTYISENYSKYIFYNNFLYDILLYDLVKFQKNIINKYNNNFQNYFGSNIVQDIKIKSNANNKIINGIIVNNYFEKKNNIYGKNIESKYKILNEDQKKLLKDHIDNLLNIVHKKNFSLRIDFSVLRFTEIDNNENNNLPSLKEIIIDEYNGNKYISIFILMEEVVKKKYLSDLSHLITDQKHLTKTVIDIFNKDNLIC